MDDFDAAEDFSPVETPSYGNEDAPSEDIPTSTSPVAPQVHVDSSASTAWKASHEKKVQAREAEHAAKKKELSAKAEAYLGKLKAERAKRIASTAAKNRTEQAKAGSGNAGLKIPGLVDLDKATTTKEAMRALLKAGGA
jgi:hypothetical protein